MLRVSKAQFDVKNTYFRGLLLKFTDFGFYNSMTHSHDLYHMYIKFTLSHNFYGTNHNNGTCRSQNSPRLAKFS